MAKRKLRGITFDSPDEVEVFHAKESWVPIILGTLPYILIGSIALIVCTTLLLNPLIGAIIFAASIVLALITRFPLIVANLDTDVVVTDKRLYARTGIIDIKDQVTDLADVSDVTVDPTVFGRIFDYADVTIQTYAGESDFVLKRIAHPYDMRSAISRGSDSSRSHDHPHNVRR